MRLERLADPISPDRLPQVPAHAPRELPSDRYLNPRPAWVGARGRALGGINLHEHVRQRVKAPRDVRLLLVELLYDASGHLGFACARQSSYAARIGRTERTVRSYRRQLEQLALIFRVDTQGVDRTYIHWEALELHELGADSAGRKPLRPRAKPPAKAALRSRTKASREGDGVAGRTGKICRSYSLDHPTERAPAERAAERACFAVHPSIAAACIRQHGAEAFAACEAEAQRSSHEPEHLRQAFVKLAITPAPEIRLTPVAAWCFWARCAAEGRLSLPKDDPAGGTAYTRLWHAQNAAHAAGDSETAAQLAEARYELGRRDEAQAGAREQVVAIVPAPVAAQLSPPAQAVLKAPTPKLLPPREAPPPLEVLLLRTRPRALPAPPPTLAEQLAALERALSRPALTATKRLRLESALARLRALSVGRTREQAR